MTHTSTVTAPPATADLKASRNRAAQRSEKAADDWQEAAQDRLGSVQDLTGSTKDRVDAREANDQVCPVLLNDSSDCPAVQAGKTRNEWH